MVASGAKPILSGRGEWCRFPIELPCRLLRAQRRRCAPRRPSTAAAALAAGERELRIDLFRGLALWLIFIDHLSPDLLTFFTIRSYGFSDAAEIFIFISGYTAAFVYGRAMREAGFVIASARILRRVWQIYVANIFLFTIFLGEIAYLPSQFHEPALCRMKWACVDFLQHPDIAIVQVLLLRFRLLNMDVLPLYVVLMFFLPVILWLMKWKADLPLALSVVLYALTSKFDLYLTRLSERLLGLQSVRLANAVRVRRVVRAGRRQAVVGRACLADHAVGFGRLSVRGVLPHADLVFPAAGPCAAALARAMDLSDQQARSGRAALRCIFWRWRRLPCASCRGAGPD